MDKKWKVLSICIGVIVLTVFIIPFLINYAFNVDCPIELFRTEWNAGDALSFYGVIIASVFTIIGVYITIQYSQKSYKENLKNQILPFFVVSNLKIKSGSSWLGKNESENINAQMKNEYEEYKIRNYCYILQNGEINITNSLSSEQKALSSTNGYRGIKKNGVSKWVKINYICHPMEIENVGNGPAISFRIGLNRKRTPKNKCLYTYGIPVKVGEKIMIHIFSEDCGKNSLNLGKYVLEFHYKDIYGNKYIQQHDIAISYSEERQTPVICVRFEEKQLMKNT